MNLWFDCAAQSVHKKTSISFAEKRICHCGACRLSFSKHLTHLLSFDEPTWARKRTRDQPFELIALGLRGFQVFRKRTRKISFQFGEIMKSLSLDVIKTGVYRGDPSIFHKKINTGIELHQFSYFLRNTFAGVESNRIESTRIDRMSVSNSR